MVSEENDYSGHLWPFYRNKYHVCILSKNIEDGYSACYMFAFVFYYAQ